MLIIDAGLIEGRREKGVEIAMATSRGTTISIRQIENYILLIVVELLAAKKRKEQNRKEEEEKEEKKKQKRK